LQFDAYGQNIQMIANFGLTVVQLRPLYEELASVLKSKEEFLFGAVGYNSDGKLAPTSSGIGHSGPPYGLVRSPAATKLRRRRFVGD
jgi:hypothetical protein